MPAATPQQESRTSLRNPGPSWGYRFLRICDRCLPEALFRPCRAIGTAIAVARMPRQRAHSSEYLAHLLGRQPRWRDVWRHFFTFEETLMAKLRVANGSYYPCRYAEGAEDFRKWIDGGGPMLLGTFHIGVSDLLGFLLGGHNGQQVCMVRLRVGNSHDTEVLGSLCRNHLRFVWVNDPHDVLFALKNEVAAGSAVAMQCDRIEHAARTEVFDFLGQRRRFSFTIYHLAVIFQRPVLLSVGIPEKRNGTEPDDRSGSPSRAKEGAVLHASPRFDPDPALSRAENLARAKAHFQEFLEKLETLLRDNPFLWFNFLPPDESVTANRKVSA